MIRMLLYRALQSESKIPEFKDCFEREPHILNTRIKPRKKPVNDVVPRCGLAFGAVGLTKEPDPWSVYV